MYSVQRFLSTPHGGCALLFALAHWSAQTGLGLMPRVSIWRFWTHSKWSVPIFCTHLSAAGILIGWLGRKKRPLFVWGAVGESQIITEKLSQRRDSFRCALVVRLKHKWDQMTNKANRSLIKRNVENLIAIILSGGAKKFECVTEIFAGKVAAHTQKEGTTFCWARG